MTEILAQCPHKMPYIKPEAYPYAKVNKSLGGSPTRPIMQLPCLITTVLLAAHFSICTPITIGKPSLGTHDLTPPNKPGNILPRYRGHGFTNQYQMVAYHSLYMLVPSPVHDMVSVVSDMYANEGSGAQIYTRLLDYATEHWHAFANLHDLSMVIGQFEFRVLTTPDRTIPLDFVQWFASRMHDWAINGFFTAYEAICVVGEAEQMLRVQMTLRVPWESLNLWDDSPVVPP